MYLEGRLIYEYGNRDHTPFGDVFGSVTNLIPVPKDAQGKQLSIRAVCPGKFRHYNYNFYPVYLGTKSAAVFNLFQQNFSSLCFCFIIVLLGITFIVGGVYMLSLIHIYRLKTAVYVLVAKKYLLTVFFWQCI